MNWFRVAGAGCLTLAFLVAPGWAQDYPPATRDYSGRTVIVACEVMADRRLDNCAVLDSGGLSESNKAGIISDVKGLPAASYESIDVGETFKVRWRDSLSLPASPSRRGAPQE